MDFITDFLSRGYFYQATDIEKLKQLMTEKSITAYIGFDCTAKSLHVGNLMQIMILRLLQKHGHKPIIIMGGGTTKIGDPSGRDETRKLLSLSAIQENITGIKKSLAKFITFDDSKNGGVILNNADWIDQINYVEFLSNYGRLFSVNKMLTMESVKSRLDREQSLTFLEFNYMLLQAYDFYHLNKEHNCILQIGGSDQWGNILMGTELIKKTGKDESFGLTTPLLTTSSGAKMGKSVNGAIWLNEDMLTPYEYYQYWRNCEDLDVLRFAKLYTDFTNEEINEFQNIINSDINTAKKQLAFALTKLCHGEEAAQSALDAAVLFFEQGMSSDNLPTFLIKEEVMNCGIPAYELFFITGLIETKSEAKRLIRGGGARINNQKIIDENLLVNSQLLEHNSITLSAGKKKHLLVKIEQ
jgi:tyrosyl-tRNA synthetase